MLRMTATSSTGKDFALADVGRIKISRRMRARALLEQDRREMQ